MPSSSSMSSMRWDRSRRAAVVRRLRREGADPQSAPGRARRLRPERRRVILLAATNRPEVLDPALLRAGRFDRQVLVDRPDKIRRVAILKVHAPKIHTSKDVDLDSVAGLTTGFTGADLANLINEAAIAATRRSAEEVTFANRPSSAIERIVAGIEKKSRVLSMGERRWSRLLSEMNWPRPRCGQLTRRRSRAEGVHRPARNRRSLRFTMFSVRRGRTGSC